jgi:hypothetical protein
VHESGAGCPLQGRMRTTDLEEGSET